MLWPVVLSPACAAFNPVSPISKMLLLAMSFPLCSSYRQIRQFLDLGGVCFRRLGHELRQLFQQQIREPKAALIGELAREFMIEETGEYARALVVEHTVAGRGGAHALHHHVEEQGLELARRSFERTFWILGGVRTQIVESLGIGGEAGVGDGGCRNG